MTDTISTPITLPSGLTLPNRLVKAAMTERLADPYNQVTERLIHLYQVWAEGGIGLQITGNVIVDHRYLEAPGNVAIDGPVSHEAREMLKRLATASKSQGGKIIMQLSHAGRQTLKMVNPEPVAPSARAVALPGGQFGTPRAMTEDEIQQVIYKFGMATRIAKETGFDGVQLHGAHGYLISQFLSPLINQRQDDWGGSLENRARLLIAVIRAAKLEAGSNFSISVKLNSTDFQKGGFSEADSMTVIEMLNAEKLDFVEISGGNYEQPKMMDLEGLEEADDPRQDSTKEREAYFLDYAERVQSIAQMPLMITGGFRSRTAMDEALASNHADLIGLARPLCVDTQAPKKLLAGELTELTKWEKILRLGPGFFGPHSPLGLIKALNGFGMQGWFYSQLHAIADGKPPNPKLGVFKALVAMNGIDTRMAKAYHKARKENAASEHTEG